MIKDLLKFLNSHGYEGQVILDNKLHIDITIGDRWLQLCCILPKEYPRVFPVISIVNTFYKEYMHLPHINGDRTICTLDPDIVSPNPDKPFQMTLEILNQAIKIIHDGLLGLNHGDYKEEFIQHWVRHQKNIPIVYVLLDSIPVKSTVLFYVVFNKKYYVASNFDALENFMKLQYSAKVQKLHVRKCLYFKSKTLKFTAPYPENNQEILEWIESVEYLNEYYEDSFSGEKLILFDFEGKLYGWQHTELQRLNGFRKHVPANLIFNRQDFLHKKISRFHAELICKNRVYSRGGDGTHLSDYKVTVIGCGSVGSYLIDSLLKLGITNFVLVDHQFLSLDNIGRHMCGFSHIDIPKVKAIKSAILNKFPFSNVEIHFENFHGLSNQEIASIENSDMIFICTADYGVEKNVFDMFKSNKLTTPIIFMWCEPYALGFHSVILRNNQIKWSQLFDVNGSFKYRVLENPQAFSKYDAGCRSTYMPYSGIDIQYYINSFIRANRSIFNNPHGRENYIFSQSGDLDVAKNQNYTLTDKWFHRASYTTLNIKVK